MPPHRSNQAAHRRRTRGPIEGSGGFEEAGGGGLGDMGPGLRVGGPA